MQMVFVQVVFALVQRSGWIIIGINILSGGFWKELVLILDTDIGYDCVI